MVCIQKMKKSDVGRLYAIALRAFQPDYEQYRVYPPLINTKRKRFLPPTLFGKIILVDNHIIGGAFVLAIGKKGELGSIFIDPIYQHKGYGTQAMRMIEELHPKVKRWKLDVLEDKKALHRFYEALGYIRTGTMKDKKSGLCGIQYEKNI